MTKGRSVLVAAALTLMSLLACGSESSGGGSAGDAGATAAGSDAGTSSRDGGSSGGGGDASSGSGSGNVCQQAATKLTGCGLSTGGIENDCNSRNACYAACMNAASCAELQGPITDDNAYTRCLSGC